MSGLVTVKGKDTHSLGLLLRTVQRAKDVLAETIASDGTYQLNGDAGSPDGLVVTLSINEAGYVGGPWMATSNTPKLDISAIRLTGKAVQLTPSECAEALLSEAKTCAIQLDLRQPTPAAVVVNSRIALDRELLVADEAIFAQAIEAAPKTGVSGTEGWLRKIQADLRASQVLPDYRELDAEAVLARLAAQSDATEGMLALTFAADEFRPDWKPDLLCRAFAEYIGIEGIHPATVEYQVRDLSEPDAAPSPLLTFRREHGVSADDLQQWAQASQTARLYLFRLAVSKMAKDEVVRARARALLARYKPKLRIRL